MREPKQSDPACRVDLVIERITDLWLKRFVDHHPLTRHLQQAGIDGPAMVRARVKDQLKSEKRFWDKTARALKKVVRKP